MKKVIILCLTILMVLSFGALAGARTLKVGMDAGPVSQDPQVQSVSGTLANHRYQGVVKEDRSVCSYLAAWDRTVLVINSLVQLKKILETKTGKGENLAALDEYTFFRDRYKRGEPESALLIITDATIRRWCGPRWRIGTSRRIRAASVMSQLQAAHLKTLVDQLRNEVPPDAGTGEM